MGVSYTSKLVYGYKVSGKHLVDDADDMSVPFDNDTLLMTEDFIHSCDSYSFCMGEEVVVGITVQEGGEWSDGPVELEPFPSFGSDLQEIDAVLNAVLNGHCDEYEYIVPKLYLLTVVS